jgi:hypothetical protein
MVLWELPQESQFFGDVSDKIGRLVKQPVKKLKEEDEDTATSVGQ